ncbi:DUF2388 domain-containing protein [Pseudomonas cannabina]|uniref:Holliday junction resolvasome, helicase subunit n=1 Tax=Pseudomonas cannabina TaxID=86840 RepID=A0A0P9MKM5_PSECA|nr:DUF2388 domain-containing protein [Pseudomonas cannabina]KAA8718274.1 DUF2388 domain-containing protein [Pseudomonas cannabina]KPW69843.1 Uncharacterized protein ALO81_01125 [Pseudomonas cannabina]RMN20875.1 hypothetical protein ALQ64_02205 [Pseudomonas cannabina]SDR41707.1 conserverd hypothetical protein [Pseudomonas cannabina]
MSLLRTLGAAFLLTAAAGAHASSFIVTTDAVVDAVNASTRATSNISSLKDDKIVLAARSDAASFVASSGEIRTARLEGALQHIRQQLPELQATDGQLAQAILTI